MGIWFILLTLSTATAMLDLGFTPAIARGLSYVLAGSTSIENEGFVPAQHNAAIDPRLVALVVGSSRRIYQLTAIVALILLGSVGTVYLFAVAPADMDDRTLGISWAIFVTGACLGLYLKYYSALLQGRSHFTITYKATIFSNLAFLIVSFAAVASGRGLVGLSLGFFVQSVSLGMINRRGFWGGAFKTWLTRRTHLGVSRQVIQALWHNAWKQGVGSVGAFLIVRGNILLVSAYVGLSAGASYALSLQVFSALMSVASVPMVVRLPRISRMRAAQDASGVVHMSRQGLRAGLSLYSLGALAAVVTASRLPEQFGLTQALVPLPMFAFMALVFLLELNHVLAAAFISTANRVPWVWPSVISGAVIVMASWYGISQENYGIAWVVFAQFAVQLAYNNWRWPMEMRRDIRELQAVSGQRHTDSSATPPGSTV